MYRAVGEGSWWDWVTGGDSSGGGGSSTPPVGESRPGLVTCWDDDVRSRLQRDCSISAQTCTPSNVSTLLAKPYCKGTCGASESPWPFAIAMMVFGVVTGFAVSSFSGSRK